MTTKKDIINSLKSNPLYDEIGTNEYQSRTENKTILKVGNKRVTAERKINKYTGYKVVGKPEISKLTIEDLTSL